MSWPARRVLTVATCAFALAAAAACAGDGQDAVETWQHNDTGTTPEETIDLDLSDHPGTTLYLLTGQNPISRDLYRVIDTEVDRLTTSQPDFGIMAVAATSDAVVVADSSSGSTVDMVLESDGSRVPLDGDDPNVRTVAGSFNPIDGRYLYSRVILSAEQDDTFDIALREELTADPVSVIASPHAVDGAWGPGGEVIFVSHELIRDEGTRGSLWRLDESTGEAEELTVGLENPGRVLGHPASPAVAVIGSSADGAVEAGLFTISDGSWTPVPEPWLPRCFDPSGELLLVADGEEVGLLEVADPTADPVRVGSVSGDFVQCSWVAD